MNIQPIEFRYLIGRTDGEVFKPKMACNNLSIAIDIADYFNLMVWDKTMEKWRNNE